MSAADICLSRDEVKAMTRSHTRAGQAKFLRANGIRHYLDAHGWPVVLRATVEGGDTAPTAAKAWKPNKAA